MRARPLTGRAISAGLYPDTIVHRETGSGRIVTHQKGGYIIMEWERNEARRHSPQKIVRETRHVQVTRARAIQALVNLDNGNENA